METAKDYARLTRVVAWRHVLLLAPASSSCFEIMENAIPGSAP